MAVLDAGERDTEVRDAYLRAAQWKNNDAEATLDAEKIDAMSEGEEFILTLTSRGYGKISSAYEYRTIGRGGMGLTNIGEPSDKNRNGAVVASFPVKHGLQLMLVTDQAKLIRLPVEFRHMVEGGFENHTGYSISGRGSSGVRIFNVSDNEQIVGAALIDETEEPENEAEEKIVEELVEKRGGGDQTEPYTTAHSDKNMDDEPGG